MNNFIACGFSELELTDLCIRTTIYFNNGTEVVKEGVPSKFGLYGSDILDTNETKLAGSDWHELPHVESVYFGRIPAPDVYPDPKWDLFIMDNVSGIILQVDRQRTGYVDDMGTTWPPTNFKDWTPAHIVVEDSK